LDKSIAKKSDFEISENPVFEVSGFQTAWNPIFEKDLELPLECKSEELSFPKSKFEEMSHYEAIGKTTMVSLEPSEIFESTKYLAYNNYNKDKATRVKDNFILVMGDQKRHCWCKI